MKATLKNLIDDILFVFDKYGNAEHIDKFDYVEVKKLFTKYDKTWPTQSIPDYLVNIFSLLKLQNYYDNE